MECAPDSDLSSDDGDANMRQSCPQPYGCATFTAGPGGGRCDDCGVWQDDSDGESNVPEFARPSKKARLQIDDLDPLEPMPEQPTFDLEEEHAARALDPAAILRARLHGLRISDEEKFALITNMSAHQPDARYAFPVRSLGEQKRKLQHKWVATHDNWRLFFV